MADISLTEPAHVRGGSIEIHRTCHVGLRGRWEVEGSKMSKGQVDKGWPGWPCLEFHHPIWRVVDSGLYWLPELETWSNWNQLNVIQIRIDSAGCNYRTYQTLAGAFLESMNQIESTPMRCQRKIGMSSFRSTRSGRSVDSDQHWDSFREPKEGVVEATHVYRLRIAKPQNGRKLAPSCVLIVLSYAQSWHQRHHKHGSIYSSGPGLSIMDSMVA
jgi:hypothetical protein